MNFDVNAFGEICLTVIPLVVFFSIFLSAFLSSIAQRSSYGLNALVAISYMLCIGVIVHELAHRLFCGIFGVKVREARYFKVDRKKTEWGESVSIGGYINCEDVSSVIVGFFLGIAPLIVNGLLVALIFYFSPLLQESAYFWLIVYLGVALALGARPSREDLVLCITALKKAPNRGILEIMILLTFGITTCVLITLQVNVWITLSAAISFLIILIAQGRSKSNAARGRYFPKT